MPEITPPLQRAPITPEHLTELVSLADPQISPDERRVVFVRSHINAAKNVYVKALWMKDLAGDDAPYPVTFGPKDGSPRWSADGKQLAFISVRGEKAQVYVLPVNRPGEAYPITAHPNGVSSFEWSPTGDRIVFGAIVDKEERDREDNPGPDGPSTGQAAKGGIPANKQDPRVIRTSPFRTGTTYFEDRTRHIYLASVVDAGAPLSVPQRISDGDVGFAAPSWSPDGTRVYSAASRDVEKGELFRLVDVVLLRATADRSVVRLSEAGYTTGQPKVSPNGEWLAFIRYDENEASRSRSQLVIRSLKDDHAASRAIFSGALATWAWSPDSNHIYVVELAGGDFPLRKVYVADGSATTLTLPGVNVDCGDQSTNAFAVGASGLVIYVCTHPDSFLSLRQLNPDGRERVLYAPNEPFVSAHLVCPSETIQFESDGRSIQGWVVKPPGFSQESKYPLVLNIHGGPHAMWGPSFESLWHEVQAMANAGYIVFFCNPRGSEGYGDEFYHANRSDWDAGPMADILRGLEHVIAGGNVDERRLYVTGGSYGGYMTAMIVGVDHRFAAAVAQRGVYNFISARNTSDLPFFFDREMSGVTPWDDVEYLWRVSPIAYARDIATPLLLEHSEQDFRVPISQAEELFTALRTAGKIVELVRWPREGHDLSRSGEPKHRVERITLILGWFEKFAHATKN